MNHLVLVRASRDYLGDAITLIRLRPRAYADAILDGVNYYLRPASEHEYLDRSKTRGYETGFNRVALLQAGPEDPSWTILFAYLVALLYGLRLTYGVLRRHREPTASAVTLAYVWLTLAYVTVVLTFMPQFAENNRIRFFLDPLAVVLLSAGARAALLRAREALSARG